MQKRLRDKRIEKGITQRAMGMKLGLTTAGYRQKETGSRRITIEEANQIASILGTTLDPLFCNDFHQND